jgi:hypothetical protein
MQSYFAQLYACLNIFLCSFIKNFLHLANTILICILAMGGYSRSFARYRHVH